MSITTQLRRFIAERCVRAPGIKTLFGDFADEFLLRFAAGHGFTKRQVGAALSTLGFDRGTASGNRVFIANLHMPLFQYISRNGLLERAALGV